MGHAPTDRDATAHFFAPERLEADGFVLRCYHPGDGAAMHEAKVASLDHLRPWMGWAAEEPDLLADEARARSMRAGYLRSEDFVLGIWTPAEDRLLGGTGFHPDGGVLSHRVAEIGMWIRADAAGQGLGTAVLRALLRWGFSQTWPWERLEWHCDARNTRSARTAEAAGMPLEARLRGDKADVGDGRRETLIFGLAREDVLAARQASVRTPPPG